MSYPVDQELKPLFPPTSARHEVDNRSNFAKALGPASVSLLTLSSPAPAKQGTDHSYLPKPRNMDAPRCSSPINPLPLSPTLIRLGAGYHPPRVPNNSHCPGLRRLY